MEINKQLEVMSHFAGIRFDLVQAGGGNSSVKFDSKGMLVKASGINLSQVTENDGHVHVDFKKTREWFKENSLTGLDKKEREKKGKELLSLITLGENGKPSIETFLHALLNTYTLHTHPISVNVVAAQEDWDEVFQREFPASVCVPYATPGIDLALSLYEEIIKSNNMPKVVFLQNHGLIISCETQEEVISLTNDVTEKLNQLLGLDLERYQNTSHLKRIIDQSCQGSAMVYCSDDAVISEFLSLESKDLEVWPFCPDTLIYCGVAPVFMSSLDDLGSLDRYFKMYSESAKVIVLNGVVYFVAASLKKAREAEELLKFHLLVISKGTKKVSRLSLNEIAYLSNWDAEKYRQGI